MLSYLAILGTCLAGYANSQPWVIAASTIALMSLSYAEHYWIYRKGNDLGITSILQDTVLKSAINAFIASFAAYGFGWLLRLV